MNSHILLIIKHLSTLREITFWLAILASLGNYDQVLPTSELLISEAARLLS